VLLVPVGESPYKRIDPEPGPATRLELAARAAEADRLLQASSVEVSRDGPSFTYRTLEVLIDERPGDEFTFLMGADVAAGIESWRNPERVVELARLAVAARPGIVLADARDAIDRLGAGPRTTVVTMPELAISSSDVRRRIAEGRAYRHLVPPRVAELIAERGLYAG
jgi:nicotinate-nucleotide adenylyltransferase